MIKINEEQVINLHNFVIEETSGNLKIRDHASLISAIESPFQTFEGKDLYPSIQQKAARLGHSLISNHPFVDGNKRTGILTMLTFLEINGINIKLSNYEIAKIGLNVANDKMNYGALLQWIIDNEISI